MAPVVAVVQGHCAEQRLRGPLEARGFRVVTTEDELIPLLAAGHRVGVVWTTAVRPATWLRRLVAAAPSFNHLCGYDALHHKGKLAFLCEVAPALRQADGMLPSRLIRDAASAAAAAADVGARWPGAWWILKDAEAQCGALKWVAPPHELASLAAVVARAAEVRERKGNVVMRCLMRCGPPATAADAPPYLLHRYVHRPDLVEGRKYDLRVYAVARADGAAFVHPSFFPRHSCFKYDLEDRRPAVHLTNLAMQGVEEGFGAVWEGVQPWTEHSRADYGMIAAPIFACVARLCLAARQVGGARHQRASGHYELLGIDFVVDEDAAPWLLEVNRSPGLEPFPEGIERGIFDGLTAALADAAAGVCAGEEPPAEMPPLVRVDGRAASGGPLPPVELHPRAAPLRAAKQWRDAWRGQAPGSEVAQHIV